MQTAKIYNSDFEFICKFANPNDFIFLDPPYYDTFDQYQSNGFTEQDHLRLHREFVDLTKLGVKCMMTNNYCDYICDLYKDFTIQIVPVKRAINCNAEKRSGQEVIITNY